MSSLRSALNRSGSNTEGLLNPCKWARLSQRLTCVQVSLKGSAFSLSVLLTEGCLNSLCADDWGACFIGAVAQSFTKLSLHPSAHCSDCFCKLILGPVSSLPSVLAKATAATPVCKFHCQGYSAWMTQLLTAIRHKSHKGPLRHCTKGKKCKILAK